MGTENLSEPTICLEEEFHTILAHTISLLSGHCYIFNNPTEGGGSHANWQRKRATQNPTNKRTNSERSFLIFSLKIIERPGSLKNMLSQYHLNVGVVVDESSDLIS